MPGWLGQPQRLDSRSENCKNSSAGKCGRSITTELSGIGHLSANTADVTQRFVQVVHSEITLHCKVMQSVDAVNQNEYSFVKLLLISAALRICAECLQKLQCCSDGVFF